MTLGGSAGGGNSKSTTNTSSTSTTPWTNIANQLSQFLGGQLKSLGSGSSTSKAISDITASTALSTKTGDANIREAFGASGMGTSTTLAKSLADFNTQQTTQLNTQIDTFEQQGVQNQLSALAQVISLASGSGTTTGSAQTNASNFQWGIEAAMKLFGK